MIATHSLRSRFRQESPSRHSATSVAETTGPLEGLSAHRVLVLSDDDNLRIGARDLGFRLCLGRLGSLLSRRAAYCELHAFFSREPGDDRRCMYYAKAGWIPHFRDIESVQTHRGTKRLANSDNDLLFAAGILAIRSKADVIVLASGDGDLVCDLSRNLRQLSRSRTILTLSLAGSTSQRLDSTRNPHVDGNIEIGMDCLYQARSK